MATVKKTTKTEENFILKLARKKLQIIDFISPIGMVLLRVWVALVFWKSGLTKLASWDTTVFLFEEEYQTADKITFFGHKFLTPEIAAFGATTGELILPDRSY